MTRFELHIDRLVLHGFPSRHRATIAAAVERELARLLAAQHSPNLLTADRTVARIDAGTFAARAGATPESIGAGIARAISGKVLE